MFQTNLILYNFLLYMQNTAERLPPYQSDFSLQIKNLMQRSNKSKNQIKMVIAFMLVSIFSNLQYNCSNLYYMNPSFYCQGIEDKVTQEYACSQLQVCQLVDKETVTAELNLYCDQRTDDRIIIQSATGVGSWIGLIFATLISDRYGRKFSFIIALMVLMTGSLIAFIAINKRIIPLVVLSQIFSGFAGKAIYFNFLILCTRFLKKEAYETVSLLWLVCSGFTEMLIATLNYEFQNWRLLFYIYIIGNTIGLIFSLLVIYEDPIYYFDTGNYQKCKQVLMKICLQNGDSAQQIESTMREIENCIATKKYQNFIHQRQDKGLDMMQIMKCHIVKNVLILGVLGCFYNMAGASIDLSIQSLKLSYNDNLFMVGASKIVGYILAIYIMKIEKQRKRGFLISSLICGIAGAMFAFKFCTENSIVQSIVIIILRIALCWNGNFYIRLKVDLFPQKYQATLMGIVEFFTNFGKTLCPLITQISINNNINPIFLINILHITFGTLPIFLLNEEKEKENMKIQEKEVIKK